MKVHLPSWRNWQTRMVQVHVLARVWGFESLRWHQDLSSLLRPSLFSVTHGCFVGCILRFDADDPLHATGRFLIDIAQSYQSAINNLEVHRT